MTSPAPADAPGPPSSGERPRTNAALREEAIARMMQTAIRLIAERGASKLSLVDVGRGSGYSHSLPNYYFGSKRRLLLDAYEHIVGGAAARFRAWTRRRIPERIRPGLDDIRATLRSYLGVVSEDPFQSRAMHVLLAESISSMPELLEVVRPWNQRFVGYFERQLRLAIDQGEVDASIDVDAVAVLLAGLLRGVIAQHLADPERVDLDRIAAAAVRLVERGLGKDVGGD